MVAKNIWSIYRKLLILGLFSGCLLYFGYFDKIRIVSAATAPCEQECEELKSMCFDNCAGAWGCDANSTDALCNSCVESCNGEYSACMASAIWCGEYGPTYEPQCQVGYGNHCPIISGTADCNHPSAHSGYYMVCKTLGNNHCVRCPDHHSCVGGGMQSCSY